MRLDNLPIDVTVIYATLNVLLVTSVLSLDTGLPRYLLEGLLN